MQKVLLKASLLVFVLGACTSSPRTSFNEAEVKEEIATRFGAFVTAMNALSTDELKTFYSNDPQFYWTEDGQIQYADKETLVASLDGLIQSLKTTDLKVLKTRVDILNGTSAMLFAEYEQAMEMQSGFSFQINGAMTVLLQKEEGIWRFLVGHSSTKKQRGG
ncbi:nuclear transport factor 2 family protein [Flavobacteriaceae bacterium 3-367]